MNALTFQPIGPRPWSEADVFCAKAKRQQQKFSVRKRSGSNKSFLCESEAAATKVFCAKAKRQQQKFSVRKRSGSNKCFLCESEAAATNVFCAKAKRQQQSAQSERKSTTRYGDELKNTS
ncbi:hypothetical protein [Bacillus sp. RS11]|uniref:hypothetical protein n=1 Tax=Lysinibacillus sp. RS11 TaxID=3242682 RepID=UPI0035C68886